MNNIKANIYGLAFKCPLGNRIPGCPFLEIEQLSNKEKMQWVNKLNVEEMHQIISRHNACSRVDSTIRAFRKHKTHKSKYCK